MTSIVKVALGSSFKKNGLWLYETCRILIVVLVCLIVEAASTPKSRGPFKIYYGPIGIW